MNIIIRKFISNKKKIPIEMISVCELLDMMCKKIENNEHIKIIRQSATLPCTYKKIIISGVWKKNLINIKFNLKQK